MSHKYPEGPVTEEVFEDPVVQLAAVCPICSLAALSPAAALAALSPVLTIFNPATNPNAALLSATTPSLSAALQAGRPLRLSVPLSAVAPPRPRAASPIAAQSRARAWIALLLLMQLRHNS